MNRSRLLLFARRVFALVPSLVVVAALAAGTVTTASAQQANDPAAPPAAAAPASPAGNAPEDASAKQASPSTPAPPAPAKPAAAPDQAAEPSIETVARNKLAKAQSTLDQIRSDVDKNRTSDDKLIDLRLKLDDLGKQVIELGVALRPRLNEIKQRLDQLGAPPPDGGPKEPQVITDERQALTTERAEINAVTGEAEKLSIGISQLSSQITDIRRTLFTRTLFGRTNIDATLLSDAAGAARGEWSDLGRTVNSWIGFVWSFKRGSLMAALFLSVVSAMVFVAGSYRIFGRLLDRDPEETDPSYISRLSVAFWSTVIPTLAVSAFVLTSYAFLENFNVLRSDIAPVILRILQVTGAMFFIWSVTRAVLVPDKAHWRLVHVSNGGARLLTVAILAMALVNGLDYVMSGVTSALGSPVVITVARSLVATIVVGAILIAVSFVRPMLAESGRPEDPGRHWPRLISIPLRLAGLALILAALSGYIGLGRFVSNQIVLTSAIFVTMYIGFLSARAVSQPENFAASQVGRSLAERFGLGPVAVDQIALAAGLGVYLVVLLFGIPLILLQWGFQPQDIKLWLLSVLTEIRIGSFSISIVGILFGVLVFGIGLIATRWFQKWLDGNVMARGRVEPGVRNSIRTGVGYLGVAVAGLIGVSAAGIDLSNLALVAGALSLGIGFGLQNIVSNFVSGLILLAERPFKVGDWVVTGTTEGFVKRISVRATEIETFQKQSIIVPNSELINASVGNWTHRNKLGRAEIPVGVAYDSDPRRVIGLLSEIALDHPLVLRNPEPVVVFVNFGDFSLDFELRVYLADVLDGLQVRNDLRLAIFERFKKEGIEIPFPQRNLNIKIEGEDHGGTTLSASDARDGEEELPEAVLKRIRDAAVADRQRKKKRAAFRKVPLEGMSAPGFRPRGTHDDDDDADDDGADGHEDGDGLGTR